MPYFRLEFMEIISENLRLEFTFTKNDIYLRFQMDFTSFGK